MMADRDKNGNDNHKERNNALGYKAQAQIANYILCNLLRYTRTYLGERYMAQMPENLMSRE